jgi:hypothetical protein
MGNKPHDVKRGFDELDPNQFAGPDSARGSRLADELSRDRSEQGEQEDVADSVVPKFSDLASQLSDVHEDINKAERVIPELESRGETQASQNAREYL